MKIKSIFKKTLVLVMIFSVTLSMGITKIVHAADGWKQLTDLNIPRALAESFVIEGKIYVLGGDTTKKSLEMYDSVENTWTIKAPMLTSRDQYATEVVDGKIFVMGGTPTSISQRVEVYDPVTDSWSTKSSMIKGRRNFQSEVVDGKIYVFGGDSTYKGVEMYDPLTDRWVEQAPMLTPRYSLKTICHNNNIYVVGGYYGGTVGLSNLDEYNTKTGNWTSKASLITPVVPSSVEIIGNKMYALSRQVFQEYDFVNDVWSLKAFPLKNLDEGKSITLNNKILIIAVNHLDGANQEYDPIQDSWNSGPSLNVPRAQTSIVSLNNSIYCIGGLNPKIPRDGRLTYVEVLATVDKQPSLSVTPSADKVKVGQEFTTDIAIHNVKNICAEDIKITYDATLYKYVGTEAQTGIKICDEDNSIPGTVQFLVASLGNNNAATDDKVLFKLKFKAIKLGQGKVDIIKGSIADNGTLEMDVAEENCGEATITVEASKDVNRNGEFSLLDLGIDAGYYGLNTPDTDASKYDTDVITDGKIDDKDLTAITQNIINNRNAQTVIE